MTKRDKLIKEIKSIFTDNEIDALSVIGENIDAPKFKERIGSHPEIELAEKFDSGGATIRVYKDKTILIDEYYVTYKECKSWFLREVLDVITELKISLDKQWTGVKINSPNKCNTKIINHV
jgi:hypothetical protein